MVEKYNEGVLPSPVKEEEIDKSLIEIATKASDEVEKYMDQLNFSQALEEIWKVIRRTNKYIDETSPWILAKEEDKERLDTVLYNLTESIRIIGQLLNPFMERTSNEILKQIGYKDKYDWQDTKKWGKIKAGTKLSKGNVLFPRLDVKKELDKLNKANEKLIENRIKKVENNVTEEYITIEDFEKIQLRVAEILEVKEHPKADKLYILKLKVGEEERQVVSGIKEYYSPEDLVGKKVVIVANLKPIKLRGEESRGMVLAAEKDGKLTLVSTLEDIDSGATIS